MQALFQQRHEEENGAGAPDLKAHRVGAGAVEGFDPQMLREPLEEQLDLPAILIELSEDRATLVHWVGNLYRRGTTLENGVWK